MRTRACAQARAAVSYQHAGQERIRWPQVAINGFGRIGRLVLRSIVESGRTTSRWWRSTTSGPVETNAHLLRYDSVHGRFPGEVDGRRRHDRRRPRHTIKVTAIRNPAELPHKELGVDIALECTGLFTARDKAAAHLEAGAKRVLVSAPCRRRRQDHRLRRQPRHADRGRPGGLQRLVHHQLPGAGGQGAATTLSASSAAT